MEHSQGYLNLTHWQRIFPKPAIETEPEPINVLLQIFVRHTLKSALDELFEFADHKKNRRQPLINFVGGYVFSVGRRVRNALRADEAVTPAGWSLPANLLIGVLGAHSRKFAGC